MECISTLLLSFVGVIVVGLSIKKYLDSKMEELMKELEDSMKG
jgi:hypothetical protein